MTEESCMTPFCKGKAKTRKVCHACLMAAWRLVEAGKTTWLDLEKAGKVAKEKRTQKKQWRTQWFMDAGKGTANEESA